MRAGRVAKAQAPIRLHWVRLRATCHPTEDEGKVRQALRAASGLDDAAFAAAVRQTALETHHGLPLLVIEAVLDRSRPARDCVSRLLGLAGAADQLAATVERRVDDDGVLYVRLDKQAAAAGELRLLDGEDAIQVRIKAETYPATRDAAIAAMRTLIAAGRA